MVLKTHDLMIYVGSSLTDGKWMSALASLFEDGKLNIRIANDENKSSFSKCYSLSPEWFTIAPRNNSSLNDLPPLTNGKQPCMLFAITKPPHITIWFLASSKNERDQWIELILPLITFKPSTVVEPPPPYSEYDNLSYYPWDLSTFVNKPEEKQSSSYRFPHTFSPSHRSGFYTIQKPREDSLSSPPPISFASLHRSGFYSVERQSKKVPQPAVGTTTSVTEAPALTSRRDQEQTRTGCCHWCSLGSAFCCNVVFLCMHQCCSNFASAF